MTPEEKTENERPRLFLNQGKKGTFNRSRTQVRFMIKWLFNQKTKKR